MPYTVARCILCRSEDVSTTTEDVRFVTVACSTCGAVVEVEFDPPDDPSLRGRIEVLVEPHRDPSGGPPPGSGRTH